MAGFVTHDSDERTEYPGGAVRDKRTGKGRFDFISPFFLKRLAELCERGAEKYGPRNWEKGMYLSHFYDSAMRHGNQVLAGGNDGEDHAVATAWNWMAFIHVQEMIRLGILDSKFDDMPNYTSKYEPGAERLSMMDEPVAETRPLSEKEYDVLHRAVQEVDKSESRRAAGLPLRDKDQLADFFAHVLSDRSEQDKPVDRLDVGKVIAETLERTAAQAIGINGNPEAGPALCFRCGNEAVSEMDDVRWPFGHPLCRPCSKRWTRWTAIQVHHDTLGDYAEFAEFCRSHPTNPTPVELREPEQAKPPEPAKLDMPPGCKCKPGAWVQGVYAICDRLDDDDGVCLNCRHDKACHAEAVVAGEPT